MYMYYSWSTKRNFIVLIHVDTIGFKFIARRCMLLIKTGPRNQYSSSFIGLAQAWALQEGNSIRALGSYVITRVSRTSTARQGNGRIVCLVIIYMCMNLMNRTEAFFPAPTCALRKEGSYVSCWQSCSGIF